MIDMTHESDCQNDKNRNARINLFNWQYEIFTSHRRTSILGTGIGISTQRLLTVNNCRYV